MKTQMIKEMAIQYLQIEPAVKGRLGTDMLILQHINFLVCGSAQRLL